MKKSMVSAIGLTILSLSLTMFSVFTYAAKAPAAKAPAKAVKTIKVGMNAEFKPFEYADSKNKLQGFDVDLALAIGKVMGANIKFVNVPWDGIIPGLLNGNYNCIMSAMTITDERSQTISFSDPYFKAGQVIVVKKSNNSIKAPNDLKGKKVSVQISTTGDIAVSKIPGVEVKRFDNIPLALIELKNGGVDAAVVDLAVAVYSVKDDPSYKLVDPDPFTSEYYGVAFKKADKALLKDWNKALATLKSNGTYDKIYEKWFPSK